MASTSQQRCCFSETPRPVAHVRCGNRGLPLRRPDHWLSDSELRAPFGKPAEYIWRRKFQENYRASGGEPGNIRDGWIRKAE